MSSLIGLKNMILFSVVLLGIGSVSAQQAFAGIPECDCDSTQDGDWDSVFDCGQGIAVPLSSEIVCIGNGDDVQLNGVGVASQLKIDSNSLFIGCDGDLTVQVDTEVRSQASLINHGSFDTTNLRISTGGLVQNSSSDFMALTISGPGTFENISTICDQQIGGIAFPVSTTTLLVAGAQANMGLLSLALVGIVGAGAAIIYKTKSKKTEQ